MRCPPNVSKRILFTVWFLLLLGAAAALAYRALVDGDSASPRRPRETTSIPRTPVVIPPSPGSGSGEAATSTPGIPAYTVVWWRPVVAPLAAVAGIPLEFVEQYMHVESGGNPCAVGDHFVSFDGGKHPLETGIAQLWGPDDYKTTGADPDAFRAYCAPKYMATLHDAHGNPLLDGDGKPRMALAFSQEVARPLTSDEVLEQAKSIIHLITSFRRASDRLLVSAGVASLPAWSPRGADYWKLVKLQHASPALAKAIGYLHAATGATPTSWNEFVSDVQSAPLLEYMKVHDANMFAKRESIPHLLANADKTGGVVQGPANA